MATVTTYLAGLSPGHTTALVTLASLSSDILTPLGGFAWAHGSDVRAGR